MVVAAPQVITGIYPQEVVTTENLVRRRRPRSGGRGRPFTAWRAHVLWAQLVTSCRKPLEDRHLIPTSLCAPSTILADHRPNRRP